jgi:hypothetical protein
MMATLIEFMAADEEVRVWAAGLEAWHALVVVAATS